MSLPVILQPGEGRSVKLRTSTCTFQSNRQRYKRSQLFEFVMEPGTEGASPHP